MERKDFLKKFAVGGSILLTAPVLFNSCSDDGDDGGDETPTPNPGGITVDLNSSTFDALGSVGGYAYKGDIIIFRTGDNTYLALSKLCTHSQCTITYDHANGELPCPCHGSKFTTSGTVTTGPANSNLKKYNVKKEGSTLVIS